MPAQALASRLLAATTYAVNPYEATKIPTGLELHLMNRLGCGYSRGTWKQVRNAGGALPWLERQLDPVSITEHPKVNALTEWFPHLYLPMDTKWNRHESGVRGAWEDGADLGRWTTLRRIYSRRQVLETMVDFWSNQLHVGADGGPYFPPRFDYDATIRKHALGRFEDMLVECTLHPSMLIYLDNFKSIRNAPNENHGRELLELHTVGRASGYTEDMVKASARILSGWTVGYKTDWKPRYDASLHTFGRVQVLDFVDANTVADPHLAERFLRHLARHRSTALTIARKMAVRFVSDTPSDELVNRLADVYRESGTDIKAMLRFLVSTAEFRESAGRKVRNTVDDLVATTRVMQVQATQPRRSDSFGNAIAHVHRGMMLYTWPRPDGAPERNAEWASATRMLSSFRMHWTVAAGYYPKVDATHRTPRYWLPKKRIRLDAYVDHLCRMLLGRPSTPRDLQAVCQATGFPPGERVTRKHALCRWMFVRMVACLLDSPSHMSR